MIFNYFKKIFIKHFCDNDTMPSVIYEDKTIVKNQGFYSSNPYDYNEIDYLSFHKQYLNNDFFLLPNNKAALEKIHDDLQYLINIFKPLQDQGIGFEIVLTGGAIRDFILGKSHLIKDLDITINISRYYKQFIAYEEFNEQADLVAYLLKNNNIAYHKLSDMKVNFDRVDMYHQKHNLLEEVIELKGINFPIQLLFTTNSHHLIHNFDFDICKIGVRVFCTHNSFKHTHFPTDIAQYVSRLEYENSFVSHVLSKKLSYHNGGKNSQQINNELLHHATRLINKYPDYILDVFNKHDDNFSFSEQIVHKILSFHSLDQKLSNKKTSVNKTCKI